MTTRVLILNPVRNIAADTFADITDAQMLEGPQWSANGAVECVFEGELDAWTVLAVKAKGRTRDDADWAAVQLLIALRTTETSPEKLVAGLLLPLADRVLFGEVAALPAGRPRRGKK